MSARQRQNIAELVSVLEQAMDANLVFKLNAGKQVGNYNLAKCRQVTDQTDRIWLEALGMSDLWDDIELEHSLVVRTSFEDDQDDEGGP